MQNTRPLPPLKALLYFETAVRHTAFSVAADELNVTPGAVSRQIGALEEFLGTKLFLRHHNRVELSASGKAYRDLVLPLLAQLRDATETLHGERSQVVHVYSPFTSMRRSRTTTCRSCRANPRQASRTRRPTSPFRWAMENGPEPTPSWFFRSTSSRSVVRGCTRQRACQAFLALPQ
jgi:DNA-binding transcriptional LysR family regulator